MTQTQSFFLQALADHLHVRPSSPPDGLDWEQLFDYAQSHQVQGIVYVQCKGYLSNRPELSDILRRLQETNGAALYCYANRRAEIAALRAALTRESIPFFIVKGAPVARFYPIPALRTMGDTDIVVRGEDRERAHGVMLSLGFESATKYLDREWQYYKKGMEYELHDRLVYEETVSVDAQTAYFNDFWKYVKDGQLDWGFHLMFLLLHLRKHLMNSGVGFRQFMDIAVTARGAADRIDWRWVRDTLKTLELLRFAEICFALCERWFDIPSPLPAEPPAEGFFESATEKIFSDGIFGYDNAENRKNAAINETRGTRSSFAAGMILRRLFPSAAKLKNDGRYAFLDAKPWLLPAAWTHRIFFALGSRRTRRSGALTVKNAFVSQEELAKRRASLEQWGL